MGLFGFIWEKFEKYDGISLFPPVKLQQISKNQLISIKFYMRYSLAPYELKVKSKTLMIRVYFYYLYLCSRSKWPRQTKGVECQHYGKWKFLKDKVVCIVLLINIY